MESTLNTQYSWGHPTPVPSTNVVSDEYDILINLVHDKIKAEYVDDETCQILNRLLGKLLILANQ